MKMFCKSCYHEIDINEIDKLKDGECPSCGKTDGFVSGITSTGFDEEEEVETNDPEAIKAFYRFMERFKNEQ